VLIRTKKIIDGLSKTLAVTECTGQGWFFVDDDAQGHGVWANGQNIGGIGKGVTDPGDPRLFLPPLNMRSSDMSPPEGLAWAMEQPRSDHPGGVNALKCDVSVKFLPDSIDVDVLLSLASRDGREQLPEGWNE
jgi:hypothetical protein